MVCGSDIKLARDPPGTQRGLYVGFAIAGFLHGSDIHIAAVLDLAEWAEKKRVEHRPATSSGESNGLWAHAYQQQGWMRLLVGFRFHRDPLQGKKLASVGHALLRPGLEHDLQDFLKSFTTLFL